MIGSESAGDAAAIRAVHLAAFPTAAEADLVDALRRGGDLTVSLVAKAAGDIVGHVACSRMRVEGDGHMFAAHGVGPLAVLPGHQKRGVGSLLMRAALPAMRAAGADIVFLMGDPAYYCRFGFTVAAAKPFASPYAGPYFMAMALDEQLKLPLRARADYAPAFGRLES